MNAELGGWGGSHPEDIMRELRARYEPIAKAGSAAWFVADEENWNLAPPDSLTQIDEHFARALVAFGDDFDHALRAVIKWTDAQNAPGAPNDDEGAPEEGRKQGRKPRG
jgi:hypothetical protein